MVDAAATARGTPSSGPALDLGALVGDGGKADPDCPIRIPLAMLNRHGLVAGATGTGKTKTLQVMAEQLSAAGRAGLPRRHQGRRQSGMAAPGGARRTDHRARWRRLGQAWTPTALPRASSSRLGGKGIGVPGAGDRSPPSGPLLLAKVLGPDRGAGRPRSDLVFHFADTNGLPLLDLKDLRAVIQYLVSRRGRGRAEEPRRAVQGRPPGCCCAS